MKEKFYLWQPHNFRRYFKFDKINFNPNKPNQRKEIPTNVGSYKGPIIFKPFNWDYKYKSINYNSEHAYYDFCGCTIRVKKNQIEIRSTEVKKKWWKITRNSISAIDKRVDELSLILENRIKFALHCFMKIHGGKSDYKIIKKVSENKVKGDDFIDKIPVDMMIHDSVMKKVYKEKNVELYGEVAVKNHFKNTTMSYIAPDIAKEISKTNNKFDDLIGAIHVFKDSISNLGKVQDGLTEQIKSHLKLIEVWRQEAEDRRKPFFVRWWEWFKSRK